jgi:hypothetical protein
MIKVMIRILPGLEAIRIQKLNSLSVTDFGIAKSREDFTVDSEPCFSVLSFENESNGVEVDLTFSLAEVDRKGFRRLRRQQIPTVFEGRIFSEDEENFSLTLSA